MWLFKRTQNRSDAELIAEYFRSGDPDCMAALFEAHVKTVYGVCLFYFRDRAAAQDAVMMIFEKLHSELRKTEIKNFKGWLSFVVRNHCISELRKQKKSPLRLESYLGFELEEGREEEDMALDEMETEDWTPLLHSALHQLNEPQRRCLQWFYLEHKSYKDIADMSSYELNEIKSHIQNGKRNLKRLLNQSRNNHTHGKG